MWVLKILIVLLLLAIAYQDFKYRAVYWLVFPVLAVLMVIHALQIVELKDLLLAALVNVLIFGSQMIMMTLYFSLKNKKWVNIANTKIGMGDILFFLVLCLCFAPFNFIAFQITGLMITLLVYITVLKKLLKKNKFIPLAGSMAAIYVLYFIVNEIMGIFEPYEDTLVLSILNINVY